MEPNKTLPKVTRWTVTDCQNEYFHIFSVESKTGFENPMYFPQFSISYFSI